MNGAHSYTEGSDCHREHQKFGDYEMVNGATLNDANAKIEALEKRIRDLEAERDRLREQLRESHEACRAVMDAIITKESCSWHPDPDVDLDNWNPYAHVEVTLTIADCRLLKAALKGGE